MTTTVINFRTAYSFHGKTSKSFRKTVATRDISDEDIQRDYVSDDHGKAYDGTPTHSESAVVSVDRFEPLTDLAVGDIIRTPHSAHPCMVQAVTKGGECVWLQPLTDKRKALGAAFTASHLTVREAVGRVGDEKQRARLCGATRKPNASQQKQLDGLAVHGRVNYRDGVADRKGFHSTAMLTCWRRGDVTRTECGGLVQYALATKGGK